MSRPAALVEFARALRDEGIPTGPATAGDLLTALETVGASSAEDVYWAFRSLAVTSRDQVPAFDRVFVHFFSDQGDPALISASRSRPRTWTVDATDHGAEGDGENPADEVNVTGASGLERLMDRDFSELTADEERQIRSLIASMVWQPAITKSQ